jgi:hypothetical protein
MNISRHWKDHFKSDLKDPIKIIISKKNSIPLSVFFKVKSIVMEALRVNIAIAITANVNTDTDQPVMEVAVIIEYKS